MGRRLEDRFEEYLEVIAAALAHADIEEFRRRWYLRCLMLSGGRKSVEPMAVARSCFADHIIYVISFSLVGEETNSAEQA